MDLIRLTGRFSRPYAGLIAAVVVLQLLSTLATLYLPDLNADIINNGVAKADVPYIRSVGLLMLAVSLLQVAAAVGAVWFASAAAMRTGRDIRGAVYDKVNQFTSEDMGHFGPATLTTRATNDVQQVQMTTLLFFNFMVAAPIMAVGGVIMALRQDAGMSWLVTVAVLVLTVTVGIIAALLIPLFSTMQKKLDAINSLLREQIAGIRVIRAFGRENFETKRFTDANTALTKLSLNIGRVFVTMFPVIMLILNLATAAVLWFGGHRVDEGLVEVGSLTAFMQYLMQILMAVMMGVFMLMMLPRAIVCGRRISEVLGYEPAAQPPRTQSGAADSASEPGTVEFRGVSYRYPGAEEPVLKNIDFTARPGTVTAVIGSTGSGKSTLLGLVPELYYPTSGEIRVNGTVAMVPQKPWLYRGTVASNLRVANPDATDEELWEALRTAQAGFVEDLDMPIAQGGTNVSGGQRQRLCIARMLVARPDVYLFDDSFSALDAVTEGKLQRAMTSYTADATVLVVAQRVASISNADQILVMEAGEIVARGTHDELLRTSSTYREIDASQKAVTA
ncbi:MULTISPECIES: ABC transporter ATP-binding protein [unclassified Corynebacterium]|uniref:ABC transporter ATP-binding protein n=1 Tax=unclassified Corynebacterium TaxID=2624378 RepID=UPI00264C4FB0|nr:MULTISPECIES: ABC transporter ATP-binding protein [unclassified Corynebacterium]MDN8595183.1 ABC transporter ATP-binding protein [Corynebacterium sp. P4_F2]WKK55312.1 ABC transporter ATP-binding protein [Corynebacterium sp. P4-C1]WKK62721.1 ABC transporter ATP-binding protein [Corynebacterium sp. P8-C1]